MDEKNGGLKSRWTVPFIQIITDSSVEWVEFLPLKLFALIALVVYAADAGLAMLQTSVPGVPGEDYPILAEVPETAFSCEGQVDGGQ